MGRHLLDPQGSTPGSRPRSSQIRQAACLNLERWPSVSFDNSSLTSFQEPVLAGAKQRYRGSMEANEAGNSSSHQKSRHSSRITSAQGIWNLARSNKLIAEIFQRSGNVEGSEERGDIWPLAHGISVAGRRTGPNGRDAGLGDHCQIIGWNDAVKSPVLWYNMFRVYFSPVRYYTRVESA